MWPTIDYCARTSEGAFLLANLKPKVDALNPPLTYTPWVTIDGNHSTRAESYLLNAVCDSYTVSLYFLFIRIFNKMKNTLNFRE